LITEESLDASQSDGRSSYVKSPHYD